MPSATKSAASLRLGQITVRFGNKATTKDISKIVGLVGGKYGCTGCGFLGRLRDVRGIREQLNSIPNVETVSINGVG